MTYFDTLKRSYVDVDTSKGIDTEQFLEATEGLVKLFGKCHFCLAWWEPFHLTTTKQICSALLLSLLSKTTWTVTSRWVLTWERTGHKERNKTIYARIGGNSLSLFLYRKSESVSYPTLQPMQLFKIWWPLRHLKRRELPLKVSFGWLGKWIVVQSGTWN